MWFTFSKIKECNKCMSCEIKNAYFKFFKRYSLTGQVFYLLLKDYQFKYHKF
jgi:hypothetical protein